jgi:hypothetical protein
MPFSQDAAFAGSVTPLLEGAPQSALHPARQSFSAQIQNGGDTPRPGKEDANHVLETDTAGQSDSRGV